MTDGASADERAEEILVGCRERIESGDTVDAEAVIAEHPEIAAELRRGFAALTWLAKARGGGGAPPAQDAERCITGTTLGPYRLESVLGSGGMGRVYLASLDRPAAGLERGARVAVKVVHPHLVRREGYVERFLLEAEVGRRVRHENVVATLDAGEGADADGPVQFLVMEHVEGRTLRALATELGKLPEDLCRHVGREIARGLAAIHAAGVIHRDLKPDNVIITRDHVVKVMDLGVARLRDGAGRLSQTGAFVGSLQYGSPEQFQDSAAIDGRADLHALGVVLYEIATGVHPFAGDDVRVVIRKLLETRPRRASELNPQISPLFEELLSQLLEKDRTLRPARADDVARILDEGEDSAWWRERARAIRTSTKRPLRRMRIPRETALHGRDGELARLRTLYERARAGDGQVVLVEGEAGIGKSRLVDEFVGRLALSGEEVNFLYGGYPPGGAATLAGAFSTAYREHIGDDEAAIRAALPQTPLLVPAFAALLRGDATPEGTEPLTKDSLQTVFVHATRSFAAQRTTIVLIDDLHFAPGEGRALFAALALGVPGHRVLLVGTTRQGLPEQWITQIDRLEHATHLTLPRLGAKDLVALLKDALRSEHLAVELAGRIAQKSDGNPFFVFEILRGLREGQFITKRSDGTWATTREIREIVVPSSVVELVQARISDLGREDRNLLEIASCIGYEFDPALVGAVLGIARIPLLQALGAIEKSHRLVRSAGRRFVFDHHQVMEVLYAGLSEPLREEYHAAIGAALEARSGAATREPKELDGALCVELAEHFLNGARGERAMRYLDAALAHLERSYRNDAAIRLAEQALRSPGLVADGARSTLLLRTAERLGLLGRRQAERAALDEALHLADADGDTALRAETRRALGSYLWSVSSYDECIPRLVEAQDLARAAGDRRIEADAAGVHGAVLHALGRFDAARERHERQLALAIEIGDREAEVRAAVRLAIVLWSLGLFSEAQALDERSLSIAREIADRRAEARVTGSIGVVLWSVGRMADARDRFERRLALSREIGDRRGEAHATANLGDVFASLGRYPEARTHIDASLALSREMDDRWSEQYSGRVLANIAVGEGDVAGAEQRFAESLALQRALGHRAGEADTLRGRGAFFAQQGRCDEARADLAAALAISRELAFPYVEVPAAAGLAALPGGDVAAALAAFAAHEMRLEAGTKMEASFLLWQATGDPARLAAAKRLLDLLVEHAPPECREPMLANVRLNREIAGAARENGLSPAAGTA